MSTCTCTYRERFDFWQIHSWLLAATLITVYQSKNSLQCHRTKLETDIRFIAALESQLVTTAVQNDVCSQQLASKPCSCSQTLSTRGRIKSMNMSQINQQCSHLNIVSALRRKRTWVTLAVRTRTVIVSYHGEFLEHFLVHCHSQSLASCGSLRGWVSLVFSNEGTAFCQQQRVPVIFSQTFACNWHSY